MNKITMVTTLVTMVTTLVTMVTTLVTVVTMDTNFRNDNWGLHCQRRI